ncbi:hypothetical protein [Anaeroselena agilis]|uniref:Calcineurin-like phosphoesterase domain-containing protein n=1 Tax=Anaeroselena agilis TaxID=3063788 RepID=A0ABU3NVR8_9FIRM|nr:hypothetical protein [Selenomonadales bacterium 4137-cl]
MYKHHEDALNAITVIKRVDADEVRVIDLADIHYGALACLKTKLINLVQRILAIPNLFVIIGGDSTESANTVSRSSLYDEACHGSDQILQLREILKPLADAKRILFVRSGNHGMKRAKATNGIPPEQMLAALLDVPFFRGGGIVILNARKNQYIIATWHTGKAPARFAWLQTNVNFFEHKHDVGQRTVLFATPNRLTKQWLVRPTINVQTSSFLGWAGYAMDEGYAPLPNHVPVAVFSGRKEDWDVYVLDDIRLLERSLGMP